MGHNIFLLDISHLTEMDMVSFIKGEIVLSDNMEIRTFGAVASKRFSCSGGNVYGTVLFARRAACTDFFERIHVASGHVLCYNHGDDF